MVELSFGTVGARKGDRRVEVTTFRQEVYPADERKPAVTFGTDLETDLAVVQAEATALPIIQTSEPGAATHLTTPPNVLKLKSSR